MIPSPNLKHMNKRKILLSQTSGKKGVSERKPLRNNDKIRSLIKDVEMIFLELVILIINARVIRKA